MSISQETKAWECEEYGDLTSAEAQGTYCWFCGERLEDENYAETTVVVDERLMWVPVCDNCGPPTLPPPMAARLACPVCDEILTPPRRHVAAGPPNLTQSSMYPGEGGSKVKQGKTLVELATEIERQAQQKEDFVVKSQALRMRSDSSNRSHLVLGSDYSEYIVNDLSHKQIGQHLGVPAVYYARLRAEFPALLDENVNTLLDHSPETERRMIRTIDGTARAFLSDRYRRLDNFDLLEAILPTLMETPGLELASCDVTEQKLYLKVTTARIQAEVKPGDVGGNYIPLFDRSYDEAVLDYEYGLQPWEEGRHPSQYRFPEDTAGLSFAQWCSWEGEPPDPRIYRQESWTEDEATAVQLYENISEGTPASPVFATPDDLGAWMLEQGHSQETVAKIMSVGRLPSGIIYFSDEPEQVT